MTSFAPKINLNRLTLPQRRYLLRLHEAGGAFTSSKELAWMSGTREQLLKRNMVEWITGEDDKLIIRMTARGQEALQSSSKA